MIVRICKYCIYTSQGEREIREGRERKERVDRYERRWIKERWERETARERKAIRIIIKNKTPQRNAR